MCTMWRSILRPAKRVLAAAIRQSPLPSTLFGPPKRVELSTKQWVDGAAKIHKALYSEVTPGEVTLRRVPQTLDPAVHWKFTGRLRQEHAPCFVAAMNNGRVWGRNGAVITPDDGLLRDVSRESESSENTHSAFYRLRLGPLRRVEKRVAVLATAWSNVYFHWM